MNKLAIFIIIIAISVSTLVIQSNTSYVSEQSILGFLNASPTLIGILLASVLTSLAIILAIIGASEMIKIHELEKKNFKNFYRNMSKNLKHDVYIILSAFILSSFLSIFCMTDSYVLIPVSEGVSFEVYKLLFVIDTALLAVSFMATYDIINGMFEIFEFKYRLSNENTK